VTPEPLGLTAPRPPRRRRHWVLAGVIVTVVVVAGGAVFATVGGASGADYRTATVATRSVAQTLDAVATIEPANQAAVAFPVSGTVASTAVAVGQAVAPGQVLATLDTAALHATVDERQAALDQAELTLERARNGDSVGGSGTSSGSGNGVRIQAAAFTPTATSTGKPEAGTTSTDSQLAAAQQAVLDAQKQVDADLLAAEQALATADRICAATPIPTASATTPSSTTTPTTPTTTDGDAGATACRDALQAVLDAQHTVSQSQTALAQTSTALDALLQARASTSVGNGTSPQSRAQSQSPSASGSGATGRTGASSSPSPTAADLIAYQKAVDAAALQLAVAEQAVAQATIVSPIAGTVVAVDFAVGDDVIAGSATQTIVIVGAGGYEVTATIGVDDLRAVKVGQAATIVPDGSDHPIKGQVVNIGIAGTSASGTTSYPVVIGIDGDSSGLRNGSIASVAIVTSAATRALAVPTSAITTQGTRHSVSVLQGSEQKTVRVGVGAMGSTWTQITSGLRAGQTVVLADMHAALPGSAKDASTARNNQGRFPGGAFPGGAFGPGAGIGK
jgi:multidrug efflux pump subunit AcrA (membrane-fusion protein)